MSFDIVLLYVDTFGSVDLTFEHYVVRVQTMIDRYLLIPKMFLETDKFGDTRTAGQINTCLL